MNKTKLSSILLTTIFLVSCGASSSSSFGNSSSNSLDDSSSSNSSESISDDTSISSSLDTTESSNDSNSSDESSSDNTSSSSSSSTVDEKYEVVDELQVIETTIDIDLANYPDPYVNVDVDEFYANYEIANSYEDAYYRTKHKLLSGELIEEDGTLPSKENNPVDVEYDQYFKNALARYEVDENGNYLSYTINTLDGSDYKIYYGAAYTSFNDVAAYLFAFNEIPANYLSGNSSSIKNSVYKNWGELGRVNFTYYSGPDVDKGKYLYEPYLKGQEDKSLYYREIDFGANVGSNHYYTYQDKYGSNNSRGVFRYLLANSYDSSLVSDRDSDYWKTPNPTSIYDRYLYFTYNHYNDFTEYLNYYNGFGTIFGNTTAGNSQGKYNPNNPPTEFEETTLALFH